MDTEYRMNSICMILPMRLLSKVILNPTPSISIAIKAFPLAMIPVNETIGAGSERCSRDRTVISRYASKGTDDKRVFMIGMMLNFPFSPLAITATL